MSGAVSEVGFDYRDKILWKIEGGESMKEKRLPSMVKFLPTSSEMIEVKIFFIYSERI